MFEKYLAGLWTGDLASGLLWQRKLEAGCHAEEYSAPSSQIVLGNRWSGDCAVIHYDEELKDAARTVDLSNPEAFAQTFTWKSQNLQLVTETGSPYLLSIITDLSGDLLTRSFCGEGKAGDEIVVEEDYVAIDFQLFSQNKYIAMIVRVGDLEVDDGEVRTYTRGLILSELDDPQAAQLRAKPHYKRIGMFEFTDFNLSDLTNWGSKEADVF